MATGTEANETEKRTQRSGRSMLSHPDGTPGTMGATRYISEDVMIRIMEQLVHELAPSEERAAEISSRVKRVIPQFIDLAERAAGPGCAVSLVATMWLPVSHV